MLVMGGYKREMSIVRTQKHGIVRIAGLAVALACLGLLGAAPIFTARSASPPPPAQQTQTIVAVGDSITYGDWDTQVAGGWVTRLATKLKQAYPKTPIVVRNAGLDGDTTLGVLNRLNRDVLAAHPQLVIVSIGTNDFDQGVPNSVFATRLTTVVSRLRAAPHPPTVVLASMLPKAGLSAGQLAAESAYNEVIHRTATQMKVGYLDLFDAWGALGHTYLTTLRHDAEHPNPIGYELLASLTAAYLEGGYLDAQGHITTTQPALGITPVLSRPSAS